MYYEILESSNVYLNAVIFLWVKNALLKGQGRRPLCTFARYTVWFSSSQRRANIERVECRMIDNNAHEIFQWVDKILRLRSASSGTSASSFSIFRSRSISIIRDDASWAHRGAHYKMSRERIRATTKTPSLAYILRRMLLFPFAIRLIPLFELLIRARSNNWKRTSISSIGIGYERGSIVPFHGGARYMRARVILKFSRRAKIRK